MDKPQQRAQQRNRRRRERAQRIQAEQQQRAGAVAGAANGADRPHDDSADDESPTRLKPSKPPTRRKKPKEPLYEEDIVDGFAILAFKSYEDLENAVKKHSEKHQARHKKKNIFLEDGDTSPVALKSTKPKSAGGELSGKGSSQSRFNNHHISSLHKNHGPAVPANNTNGNQASYPSSYDSGGGSSTGGETRLNGLAGLTALKDSLRDDRLSDASSNASSGRGYICDSESEDDKASDTGSDLFTASRKSGELPASPRRSATAPSAAAIPTSSAATGAGSPVSAPTASLPGVISLRVPHRPSRRPINCLQPASARASPDSPPPRVLSSASPPPSALAAVAAMVTEPTTTTSPPGAAPPASAPPSYPPLYVPYSTVPGGGGAAAPYLAPSSPGAAAAIHRNERLSKSPAPNASKSSSLASSGSPLQPPSAAGIPLWTPAIGLGGAASTSSSAANRDTNSASLGKPPAQSPNSDRDLFGNVSSLSRSASSAPSATSGGHASPSTLAPSGSAAPSSTATSGGLLSFSAKSPVVSASVAPPTWGAAPPSAPPFGQQPPPTSASSMFPVPMPPSSSSVPTSGASTATTSAANPNPFSAESLFTTSADMLRRELDSRFLASSQDRASLAPPPFLRAEMHHHQHQHTHVHQHTSPIIPSMMPPPMFKQDIPKLPGVDSPFYRQSSLALSAYNSFTPSLLHPGLGSTPFNPPTLTPFAPKIGPDPSKPKPVKTGKWNAMHVRIAWEIHRWQQDKVAEAKAAAIASGKPPPADMLRPPTGPPHHLFGGPLPPPTPGPGSTAFSALPPAPPAQPPHHRPAPFVEPPPPPASFLSPHLSPFARFPGFGAPPGASPFAGLSPLGTPGVFPSARDMNALGQLTSPVHEQWNRLHRAAPGFPPVHGSPWSSLGKPEMERREHEERERQKRERERAELERAEKERAAQLAAAAELARKKEERERRERERERELERREREREKKLMLERQQQHQQQMSSSHHAPAHRGSGHSAATPPDRTRRDRSPLRPPTENGPSELKVKEERLLRESEDKMAAVAMMERDRFLYMTRGLPPPPMGGRGPPGTPLPPHPFAGPPGGPAAWDPYHPHHRFDPLAMRFNPLAAHAAAAAAMYREREEAAMGVGPSLYGPPMMDRKVPQAPPGSHKLATPPPHMYSPLAPPQLLGAGTPPSARPSPKMLGPPMGTHKAELHKKEPESQSSR